MIRSIIDIDVIVAIVLLHGSLAWDKILTRKSYSPVENIGIQINMLFHDKYIMELYIKH